MATTRKTLVLVGIWMLSTACFAQQAMVHEDTASDEKLYELVFTPRNQKSIYARNIDFCPDIPALNLVFQPNRTSPLGGSTESSPIRLSTALSGPLAINLGLTEHEDEPFFRNRRNVYSSLWAFTSLNYLYADLVGLMDKDKLLQYQTGVVDGVKITPEFLTIAAGFMQIPLANVFLPQVIKNERTLRWVQIASGAVMTLVQSGTLFVGKQAPYYVLFSAIEIATTSYITIDAIKWKPNASKRKFKGK